jgi:hypothetical protein
MRLVPRVFTTGDSLHAWYVDKPADTTELFLGTRVLADEFQEWAEWFAHDFWSMSRESRIPLDEHAKWMENPYYRTTKAVYAVRVWFVADTELMMCKLRFY